MTRLLAELAPGGGILARPVQNSSSTWTARRGLVLRLSDEQGRIGQGEASPLPDFSRDDFASAAAALGALTKAPLELDLEEPLESLLVQAGSRLDTAQPAAHFALETALLDLVGQRQQRPLWSLLQSLARRGEPPARLPLCALVDAASELDALRSAAAAVERGIGTLKLKVGRPGEAASDLRKALALRDRFGSAVRLRLDANRAWSPVEAALRLQELSRCEPEFVEEAIDPAALAGADRLPVPLALDESLLDADWLGRRGPELASLGVKAVVLKPMLLGGFGAGLRLSARARELGISVVVSHLFDGPIALAATAALGLAVAGSDRASGLDRHPGLACWPTTPLPMISDSEVLAWEAPGLGLSAHAGVAS